MALLLFSTKCSHSNDILKFINKEPQLKSIVRLHDIGVHGVPAQLRDHVKSVPTLVTNKNQILVGSEVKNWLQSLIPPAEFVNCNLTDGYCSMASLADDDDVGNFFDLGNYGQSLQPFMTPELQEKISKKVA
jgi:hypothetical protein